MFKNHCNGKPIDTPKEKKKLVGRKRTASDASQLSSASAIKKRRRASSIQSVESEKIVVPLKNDKPVKDVKFCRVDASKFDGKIRSEFMDWTFEAKNKFGASAG